MVTIFKLKKGFLYVQEDQTRGNLSFNLVCAEMNVVNGNEKNSVFDGWIDEVANLFGGCNEKNIIVQERKNVIATNRLRYKI